MKHRHKMSVEFDQVKVDVMKKAEGASQPTATITDSPLPTRNSPSLTSSQENVINPNNKQDFLQIIQKRPPISQLLSEASRGEISKQFRSRNPMVIDYITRVENMSYLLSIIAKGEAAPPILFWAGELLTADIPQVLGVYFLSTSISVFSVCHSLLC